MMFFDSDVILQEWYVQILQLQGFENFVKQYEWRTKLGEGVFGDVLLARHKLTRVHCAMKLLDKRIIKEVFAVTSESYQEIALLDEVTTA